MKRAGLAMAVGALFLALSATVALAAVKYGTNGADTIYGTNGADTIYGQGGNDTINGLGGDDALFGGSGRDEISGGAGQDRIFGGSGDDALDSTDNYGTPERDEVYCGGGFDSVTADYSDFVAGDCEAVTRIFG